MPSNHCEGVKPKSLASRGALHCMCPIVLAELTASYQCVLQFFHSACYAKRHLNVQKCSEPVPLDLEMCFAPQRRALFRHLNLQSGPSMVCFVHFDLAMCFAPQHRAPFRHLNSQLPKVVRHWNVLWFVHFDLEMCFAPQRHVLFSIGQLPKVVRTWCALRILTCKFASRHNGVHFFDITTSKRAEVLYTFWLRNVLRATTACNLSSLIWPDGSAPAALASLLFDPPNLQIIGKTQCLATFLPFLAPAFSFLCLSLLWFSSFLFSSLHFSSILFTSLLFSSLTLPVSAFHLSILSDVWRLNLLRT